jgi:hypothetical protein
MAGLKEFYCGSNEPSHAFQFKWLEYTFNIREALLTISSADEVTKIGILRSHKGRHTSILLNELCSTITSNVCVIITPTKCNQIPPSIMKHMSRQI